MLSLFLPAHNEIPDDPILQAFKTAGFLLKTGTRLPTNRTIKDNSPNPTAVRISSRGMSRHESANKDKINCSIIKVIFFSFFSKLARY